MTPSKRHETAAEGEVDKSTQPFAVERAAEPVHQGSIEGGTPEPAEDRTEPGAPRRRVVAGSPVAAAPPAKRSMWPVLLVVGVLVVGAVAALAFAMSGGGTRPPDPGAQGAVMLPQERPAVPPVPAAPPAAPIEVAAPVAAEIAPPPANPAPVVPAPTAPEAVPKSPALTVTPAKPPVSPTPAPAEPAPPPVEPAPVVTPPPEAPKGGVVVTGDVPLGLMLRGADGAAYRNLREVPPGSYTLVGAFGTELPHGLGSIVVQDSSTTIKCSSVIGQCSNK